MDLAAPWLLPPIVTWHAKGIPVKLAEVRADSRYFGMDKIHLPDLRTIPELWVSGSLDVTRKWNKFNGVDAYLHEPLAELTSDIGKEQQVERSQTPQP